MAAKNGPARFPAFTDAECAALAELEATRSRVVGDDTDDWPEMASEFSRATERGLAARIDLAERLGVDSPLARRLLEGVSARGILRVLRTFEIESTLRAVADVGPPRSLDDLIESVAEWRAVRLTMEKAERFEGGEWDEHRRHLARIEWTFREDVAIDLEWSEHVSDIAAMPRKKSTGIEQRRRWIPRLLRANKQCARPLSATDLAELVLTSNTWAYPPCPAFCAGYHPDRSLAERCRSLRSTFYEDDAAAA